jgi:RNA polymerase sigma-54 factor
MELQQTQSQTPNLRQEQVLTHQQIQALEILAAPVEDLRTIIRQEIERNPVLELAEDEDEFTPIPDQDEHFQEEEGDDDDWMAHVLSLDDGPLSASERTGDDEEKRRNWVLQSITAPTTVEDNVLAQLHLLDLEPHLLPVCELLAAGLDGDGFLTLHPADVAMVSGVSIEVVEQAVAAIQSCDPPGIGARSLKERLLLQLDRAGMQTTLAYRVVQEHLEEIAANKLPAVARKLGTTLDALRLAVAGIRGLQPHLPHATPTPAQDIVNAEVSVQERNGRFEVDVDDDRMPVLRISQTYRALLGDASTPQETRDYIRERIRAAVTFMSNLSQRQTTLQRIVQAIVSTQSEFFRQGPQYMKPLVMAQIATEVGVHETTVSRAVNGKFLRCRYGLVPLRSFFTAGLTDDGGNTVSNAVIKQAVRDLIAQEDTTKPLSDSAIASQLRKQSLRVARRTVAKYRECLSIPPSHLRRAW